MTINVREFGATGDGATDDRLAIKAAFQVAASRGGETIFFPPGTYVVGRDPALPLGLDLQISNVTLQGVRGQSWLKQPAGLPSTPTVLLRLNDCNDVTIRELGLDGNWGNAATKLAAGSHGQTLPQSTIHVVSTDDFASSGVFNVVTNAGREAVIYTGKTDTTFTGCSGGSGTMTVGGDVGYADAQAGLHHDTKAAGLTSIAAGSNGQVLPQSTIHVSSTAGFPTHSVANIETTLGVEQVAYTGITATTLTGCTGGAGTMTTGDEVFALADPQSHTLMIRGATNVLVERCLLKQSYGDLIWIGYSSTDVNRTSENVQILSTTGRLSARNGITCQGRAIRVEKCEWTNIFAQAFDTEPVDVSVRDVVIDSCYLGGWWHPGNPQRGANSPLSIVGGKLSMPSENTFARSYRVRNCDIRGSVLVQNCVDVKLESNRIVCDWNGYSYAPILIQMVCDDIWITDNYIYDRTTAIAGASHDASVSVQYYGAGPQNYQPAGVVIARNSIHSRNGRHGIKVAGTGGYAYSNTALLTPDSGTTTGVSASPGLGYGHTETATATLTATTLTDTNKSWTMNEWAGYALSASGSLAIVTSNTATQLTFSDGWVVGSTPAVGQRTYELQPTLTDSSKSWTSNRWVGYTVRIGARLAKIRSNLSTVLVLFTPTTAVTWSAPQGEPTTFPRADAYVIESQTGIVDVAENSIDCSDDGHGNGGNGIELLGHRSGMRVRVSGNKVKNADSSAIRTEFVDANRKFLHLEISDNKAWDDQIAATCTHTLEFSGTPQYEKLVLRGNSTGDNVANAITGLTTGTWLEEDGHIPRWAGYGSPEGVVTAPIGAMYRRLNGGAGTTLYVKQSGTGNTGWSALS